MEDLFRSYWWLLFPLAWFISIGFSSLLNYRRGWLEASEPSAGVSAEDRLALEAAMVALPSDQRACVALCLADGFSHPEAAAILGLPLGTVKSHVTRGRARLLAALTGEPHDV